MPAINSPTPDATTITKGKIQLAGDLSGTAALPRVSRLTNSAGAKVTLANNLGLNNKISISTVLTTSYATYATVTATSNGGDIELSYGANLVDGSSGANRGGNIRVQMDGTTVANSDLLWRTNVNDGGANLAFILGQTGVSAGSHTWTLQLLGGTASATNLNQAYLKVVEAI